MTQTPPKVDLPGEWRWNIVPSTDLYDRVLLQRKDTKKFLWWEREVWVTKGWTAVRRFTRPTSWEYEFVIKEAKRTPYYFTAPA